MVGLWLSLAFLLVAVVAGVAFAALRGLSLYRAVKRVGGSFSSQLESISERIASIEQHVAAAEAGMKRLSQAGERLQRSRAQLDVQRAAVREARAQVRRVFWFVPGI